MVEILAEMNPNTFGEPDLKEIPGDYMHASKTNKITAIKPHKWILSVENVS